MHIITIQKHGTTSKPLKASQLDQEEQEKIAKSGLEMKMLTNEMDAETDKWNGESDENNDIVKRAKNMSSMAFSMYQFTKGEGTLRTTQDLFTQAEYFAEEANRLYKVVREFSYQVKLFYFNCVVMYILNIYNRNIQGPRWRLQKRPTRSLGQSADVCANSPVHR